VGVISQSRIAGHRAADVKGFALDTKPPTASELLQTIGAYIPTDVTALYVPVAAGLTVAGKSDETKLWVAIGVALLAAFATWVLAHQAATKLAGEGKKPSPVKTLTAGWYEILVAGAAFFVWALAIPDSFVDWGTNAYWAPALIVAGASIIFGGVGVLLNRARPGQ
jgi:hypothetical protein